MAQAGGKQKGLRLTTGTARGHERISSLKAELLSDDCPLAVGAVHQILAGPGGFAPLAWCATHKITDPLANEEVRKYYWHHFGVATTKPTSSVHAGCTYFKA